MVPNVYSTTGRLGGSLVNDQLADPRLYTPKEEADHDAWRARMARESQHRRDSLDALIPRAKAGDPEAQGILRAAGAISGSDPGRANAWAAQAGLSTATVSQFGLKG